MANKNIFRFVLIKLDAPRASWKGIAPSVRTQTKLLSTHSPDLSRFAGPVPGSAPQTYSDAGEMLLSLAGA